MSNLDLTPYLFFCGNAAEAMAYYKELFGGELTTMKYSEMPDSPAGMEDKIMHANLKGGMIHIMASDSTREKFDESFISMSLTGSDEEAMRELFAKLAEGGKITHELAMMPWGDFLGDVTDKFGVDWIFSIEKK